MGPNIEVTKHNLLIYDSPSNFPKKNKLIKGKVIHVGLDFKKTRNSLKAKI